MKLDAKAEAALREPGVRAITVEMTPELKKKYSHVTGLVVDLLRTHTTNPLEAYMVLQFVQNALEARFGIRAGLILGDDDPST